MKFKMLGWLLVGCFALSATVTAVQAQQEKKKKRQGNQNVAGRLTAQLKKLELTEEQSKKIREIVSEYRPKIAELQKKARPTADQRKARAEATKKANAEGLKGKARREFIAKESGMTPEQKEAAEALAKLQNELRSKVVALLTPEQKAKLRSGAKKGGKKKKDQ